MTQPNIQSGEERLLRAIFAVKTYRDPGEGAIEFAKEIIGDMSRRQASVIMSDLLAGNLHDKSDKRIKRCDHCGYYWRDDSLRNTRKTCSDECRRKIKTLQRQKQREKQALFNPKPRKRTLMDDYYYWLEYPYWADEYSMLKIGWKYEVPHRASTIDFIEAKNELYGEGNRVKPKRVIDYHGDNRDDF